MKPDEILHALTHANIFDGIPPQKARKAATRRRAEMLPLFLREIDSFVAASRKKRMQQTPLTFIYFLFAEWRETSAYRPL